MLSKFAIKNYLSIVSMQVDFSYAEGKAPNGYKNLETRAFLEVAPQKRLVPCMALIGGNASGKSNILRAIATFCHVATGSIKDQYRPNKLHPKNQPTAFTFSCFIGGQEYAYSIEYNDREILHESFSVGSKQIYSINGMKLEQCSITNKDYPKTRLMKALQVEGSDYAGATITHQKSFLFVLRKSYAGLSPHIGCFFNYLEDMLFLLDAEDCTFKASLEKFCQHTEQPKDVALQKIVRMIQNFDVAIKDIKSTSYGKLEHNRLDFVRTYKDAYNGTKEEYYTLHSATDGRDVIFSFAEESSGTNILFNMMGILLLALDKGYPLFIDELDRSLHAFITQTIVTLFKNRASNPYGAQLIFVTHSTDILDNDHLRVSEVGFVDKTLKNGTTLRRLSDFSGVRNVTNFRKNYLAGAYGAIPFPHI